MGYNYQIIIEYDGSKFVGWQLQKNGKSIQGEIQKVIKQVFGMHFRENIIGSGRTDAGVHAFGQVSGAAINIRPLMFANNFFAHHPARFCFVRRSFLFTHRSNDLLQMMT